MATKTIGTLRDEQSTFSRNEQNGERLIRLKACPLASSYAKALKNIEVKNGF